MNIIFSQVSKHVFNPLYQAQNIFTRSWQWFSDQVGLSSSGPLFSQALGEDIAYNNYLKWHQAFKKEIKKIRLAFRSVGFDPQILGALLTALQANIISPFQYDRALTDLGGLLRETLEHPEVHFDIKRGKKLLERLEAYLNTINSIRTNFKISLAAKEEESIDAFYNDLINGLIEQSFDITIYDEKESRLPIILAYYQDIVPSILWQTVAAKVNTKIINSSPTLSQVQQINQVFTSWLPEQSSLATEEETTFSFSQKALRFMTTLNKW